MSQSAKSSQKSRPNSQQLACSFFGDSSQNHPHRALDSSQSSQFSSVSQGYATADRFSTAMLGGAYSANKSINEISVNYFKNHSKQVKEQIAKLGEKTAEMSSRMGSTEQALRDVLEKLNVMATKSASETMQPNNIEEVLRSFTAVVVQHLANLKVEISKQQSDAINELIVNISQQITTSRDTCAASLGDVRSGLTLLREQNQRHQDENQGAFGHQSIVLDTITSRQDEQLDLMIKSAVRQREAERLERVPITSEALQKSSCDASPDNDDGMGWFE